MSDMKKPARKEDKITLRLEPDLRLRLEEIAGAEGRSVADVVRRLLKAALEKKRKKSS